MFSYMSWSGAGTTPVNTYPSQEMPFLAEDQMQLPGVTNATQAAAIALENGLDWLRDGNHDLLFVAVLPRLLSIFMSDEAMEDYMPITEWNMSTTTGVGHAIDWAMETATVLRCELVASEYLLGFSYQGLSQEQNIEILDVTPTNMSLDPATGLETISGVGDTGCFSLWREGLDASDCALDTERLLQMSYRAVADVFNNLLVGAANPLGNEAGAETTASLLDITASRFYNFKSQVLSTSLADTIELGPMAKAAMDTQDLYLGEEPMRAVDEIYSMSRNPFQSNTHKHLKDAIEETFFNITMSMASSPQFTYNASAPNAPVNVTVTINNVGNIYCYSPEKLWLAYGLTIGITMLNVCLGLMAIFRTGASFTLNFSTIVRAAKNANVNVETDEARLPGRDPLPEEWKKAVFKMRTPSGGSEGKGVEKGEYNSVDQSVEGGERVGQEDAEELIDQDGGDERRLSWESGEEEELQLAGQRGREDGSSTHSNGPREDDELVQS